MISRRSLLAGIPLMAFAALALVFWVGLSGEPSRLPSALLNKKVPAFALPPIAGSPWSGVASADLAKGQITLINIFASWCGPCRDEHPILLKLSQRTDITVYGINNKDDPVNAIRFLNSLGNPYAAIGADVDGRITIDWGGYGVPETFIVDGNGIIRHKVVGPLSEDIVAKIINHEIEKAKLPLAK